MPNIQLDWKFVAAGTVAALLVVYLARRSVMEVAEAIDPTDPNNVINRKVTAALQPGLGTNKLTGKPNTIGSKLYFLFNE